MSLHESTCACRACVESRAKILELADQEPFKSLINSFAPIERERDERGHYKVFRKSAVELVSDIGSKAFNLQHYSEQDIAEAVKFNREVNGQMFDWLVKVLSAEQRT